MRWTTTPAPVPADPADLTGPEAWAVHGISAVSHAVDQDHWGHTDIAYSARYLATRLREQAYTERTWLVATAPDRVGDAAAVVGAASVALPRQGNEHLAFLDVMVHPEHRRRGIGSTLLEAGQAIALAGGRRVVISASEHPGEPPADDPETLSAPTGSGRIRRTDAPARFAARHGYSLSQAERYSVLDLPVAPDHIDRLHDDASRAARPAYRTVTWADHAPEEWVDQFALIETRMSTDSPLGELEIVEDVWDAARIHVYEQGIRDAGHGYVVVAAVHRQSGELAGLTMVEYALEHDEPLFQEDTLVLRAHRGHRLGLLVKSEMVRRLATARPAARRIHTWNAEENHHMLAINVALGFTPRGVCGMWQRCQVPGPVQ